MPRTRINHMRVKLHRSYTVDDASRLLGVHKNTIRNWLKNGLSALDDTRPSLILGRTLRAYLAEKRESAKCPSPPGTFYCFRCREPRRPALGMVECSRSNDVTGNLSAICATCSTVMHRRVNLAAIPSIMPGLDVQIAQAPPRIRERHSPSLNCDKRKVQ